MDLRKELKSGRLYLDGGMGTLLQEKGLAPGELPERWNLTHPDVITAIHREYFDAGSHIVCANTFGANPLKFGAEELEEIVVAALANARRAAELSDAPQKKYVALDIGPLGRLLKPYGDLDFEEAVEAFAAVVRIGAANGADLVMIETMGDSYETKAAVLAAKENCELPVMASNAYGADRKTMTGASPAAMAVLLSGLGVDAVGTNCSLGPRQLADVARELLEYATVPVFVKPNAGLPTEENRRTVFSVSAEEFAGQMRQIAEEGVNILGGCCGTTPAYIRRLVAATRDLPPTPVQGQGRTCVSSYTHCVEIGERPVVIGERINPTGKKRFKQALLENDIEYILREGLGEQDAGAEILDVNVGLPGIDEAEVLCRAIEALQGVLDLPLQLDSSDPIALGRAMRRYNGKPMVNSVNGKEESMAAVFPLLRRYGGVAVALTLDEGGIPPTAEGRCAIAEKILSRALEYGIRPEDIVFDPLCMAVSAEADAARTTLRALRLIREKTGCRTVLGVSNVSYGLPAREIVNAGFLSLALEEGLSAAIMNPGSREMTKSYRTFLLLHGMDKNCASYIAFAEDLANLLPAGSAGAGSAEAKSTAVSAPSADQCPADASEAGSTVEKLRKAILRGMRESAAGLAREALRENQPLTVVNTGIVPALDTVGRGFESKSVYLPQLLMSAEAAKAAFEEVRLAVLESGAREPDGPAFVLATVRGDIHDIGKNIVRVLLENYGYRVIDLGRDVPPETVAEAVVREGAAFCGLSALMTTTVPAMEETVRLVKKVAPGCRIVVGGAVLTADYAARIGADQYAADAMETVRYAESLRG